MKITFKENDACCTEESNGDLNINPKTIIKFGYIEGINMVAKDFVFGGKDVKMGINIKTQESFLDLKDIESEKE